MNDKCDECGADLVNTPSGHFSTCPKGHGKLKPAIMPKPFDTVEVPLLIACCPECGGTLEAECKEWTLVDGIPRATQCGLLIRCTMQNPLRDDGHLFAQSDWIPVRMEVYEWLEAVEA